MKPYKNEIIDKILDSPLVSDDTQRISDNVWSRIDKRTTSSPGTQLRKLLVNWRPMVAAALIIILLGSAFLWYESEKSSSAIPLSQVATPPGSNSRLALPDGTQVWLNGDSKITYSNAGFGTNNREVTLRGEAFFDVVKNEKVPFIIHTGKVNILVKGTAFNVKAYPGDTNVETSLVRGLVEISVADDPERKITLKPNEKITISTRPAITVEPNRKAENEESSALYSITQLKSGSDGPAELAWMNAQLIFDNEPFEAIARKLESWFNITIHFTNEGLKKKRFSAVIEKESLTQTLDAMKLSCHFNYKIKNNEVWIGNK